MSMRIKINTDLLDIQWVKNTTYRVELDEGVFVEVGNNRTPNTANENLFSFTTNATGPVDTQLDIKSQNDSYLSDTQVEIVFDRKIFLSGSGSVRLFTNNDILVQNFVLPNNNVIIEDTKLIVKIKDFVSFGTSHYVLIDTDAIVDFDKFDYPGIQNKNNISLSVNKIFYVLDNPNFFGTPAGDEFGLGLAINNNYIAAGARSEQNNSGVVYIFDLVTRELLKTIVNPNAVGGPEGDSFGNFVHLEGDLLLVGAPGEKNLSGVNVGAAYLFDVTTGDLLKTFLNPDTPREFNTLGFGACVRIVGNFAVIGDPNFDGIRPNGSTKIDAGKIYIFNISTGQLTQNIINPSTESVSSENFGISISSFENNIIVGAPGFGATQTGRLGRAYIYNVTNGQLILTLNDPDGDTGTVKNWGSRVLLSENYAIVSRPGTKIHVFNPSTGTLISTISDPITPDPLAPFNFTSFGAGIDLQNDLLIVGSSDFQQSSGRVYIFNIINGNLLKTIENPNIVGNASGDLFGAFHSNIFNGRVAAIPAFRETNETFNNSGIVYLFNIPLELE